MNENSRVGIYLRLSRDDEGDKESISISNQRQMLMSFLSERTDLEFVSEYVDDGYTGYDFNRPQFQKMLEDAKDGKIDCIMVKDLSRLGRNFQKTEEYIQRIFPKLGIRFISVTNCFDSKREPTASELLLNPVINLMNEFHVMETSQKVRSVLEHHRRSGKFIGNHAPFGYLIQKRSLVVDEDAADVVRSIFRMKIEGLSNQGIAAVLNGNCVNSPLEYKLEKGISATGTHLRDGEKAAWSSVSVRRILENPVYIGTLVQGKTTSVSYRDKRRFMKDKSEMAVFEDAHDAIISDTSFLIVQDLLNKDSYSNPQKHSYLFSGFAYCGGCGRMLYHRQDGDRHAWQCRNKACSCKGNISEKALSETAYETLKAHMNVVLNHTTPTSTPEFIKDLHFTDFQLEELEQQMARLYGSKDSLLKQMQLGVISEEDYAEMNRFYDSKIAKLKFEIEEIQHKKARLANCVDEIRAQYERYYVMTELTRELVVSLIQRIVVYSKTHIYIQFRYGDFFKGGDVSGS